MMLPSDFLRKLSILVSSAVIFAFIPSCGQGSGGDTSVPVKGYASIGVHCPQGTYQDPVPVRLELVNCPNINQPELAEPLKPIIVQADCQSNYFSVRSIDHSTEGPSWEAMPDHSFSIVYDGGNAKFKSDGHGNTNCIIPTSLVLSGRFECTGSDAANIYLEGDWKLGEQPPANLPSPRPSVLPSPRPSASPHPSPMPSPTFSPVPFPSGSPLPQPSPSRPWWWPLPPDSHAVQGNTCNLPSSCYLRTVTVVKQCR